MATGLPVLVGNTGGNPEVVEDRVSGRLFPVGNSAKLAEELLLLYGHADLREQLGRAAVVRVENRFFHVLDGSTIRTAIQYRGCEFCQGATDARRNSRSSFQTEELR